MTEKTAAEARAAFSKRLNDLLDAVNFPSTGQGRQTEIAKLCKLSQGGARRWLVGESMPQPLSKIDPLIARTGGNKQWLLTGEGEMFQERGRQPIDTSLLALVVDVVDEELLLARTELPRGRYANLIANAYQVGTEKGSFATMNDDELKSALKQTVRMAINMMASK